MKKIIVFLFVVLTIQSIKAQQDRYVLLISIDGLRPDFYMDEDWVLQPLSL